MKKLYVLVGYPASGKSTKAKELLADGVVLVSRDSIRKQMLQGSKQYFSKEKAVYKSFSGQIQEALDGGKSVVADATHINGASRSKLLSSLKLDGVEIIGVYMKTPFDVCIERNLKRTGFERVPEEAMESMRRWATEPSLMEGFDKIIVIGGGK